MTIQKSNNFDKYNPAKIYGSYIFNETLKYQKKYNFDIGQGKHATWNNEADAFKHTFMQAHLTLLFGENIAKILGDKHEKDGNLKMGQSKAEENMDLWNNQQGRQIAHEIIKEYGHIPSYSENLNDIIAKKVIQKMNNGELITTPTDSRNYHKTINYTREDIKEMTNKEFTKHEKAIMQQLKTQGIPKRKELSVGEKSEYSKNKFKSNSSSGQWVTINGNHVLLKK